GCRAGRPGRPTGSWRRASRRRSAAAPRGRASPSSPREGSRLPLLEEHEHAQLLVADETVLGAGGDEDGVALAKLDLLTLDLERASAFEDDVDLVVLMRRLAVGLRRDEDVDADLESGRAVDDLVPAVAGREPRLRARNGERGGR